MSIRTLAAAATMILLVLAAPALAHVQLDAPNGGEMLTVGSSTTVEWHIQIGHPLENWDLWYSVDGSGGPWIPIATDLPPGDPSTGSVHTYQWTIPDTPATEVRVRVRQDNVDMDYEDISDGDLAIVADAILADGFESGDTTAWSTVVP